LELGLRLIVMQAASTEPDANVIGALMGKVLLIAHAHGSAMRIRLADHAFGWNFYTVSIDREVGWQLTQLPESGVMEAKGDSLGQKFAARLNRRANAKGPDYNLKPIGSKIKSFCLMLKGLKG
jgi:hypothetical protein